jgi:succinyl-CoA synthetase beta subunit
MTQELSVVEAPSSFAPAPELLVVVNKLWQLFLAHDATLIEINPLVKSSQAEGDQAWYCLDAKIELEDTASYRHPEWLDYPEKSAMGRPPTQREMLAHEVSRRDHRGVAGESFFEFAGGEIGVLAAGGGASILAMDALVAHGLKPANYTEHSGNPPREKVKAITDVILSIPDLKGLFVVGTNANFTDIFETLSGVVDSLLEQDLPDHFPVLFRRGGPRWQEAFAMIDQRLTAPKFKVKTFGPDFPIVKTAIEMKELIKP